jgi:hypothetical protein
VESTNLGPEPVDLGRCLCDDVRCQTKTPESVRFLEDCHSQIVIILVPNLERTSSTFLEDSLCDMHVYMDMLYR